MSNSHTPGPWIVAVSGQFADTAYVRAENWGTVAAIGLDHSLKHWDDPQRANAILISAAPDLLEALRAVLHDCEDLDMYQSNEPGRSKGPWLMATEAIAKAIGATR